MARLRAPKFNFFRFKDSSSQFSAAQFTRPERPIPWKAIIFAAILFAVGSTFLIIGALIAAGYITQEAWVANGIPFVVLGSIMFLPGVYHVHLAYCAWMGYHGYSFEQIPNFED